MSNNTDFSTDTLTPGTLTHGTVTFDIVTFDNDSFIVSKPKKHKELMLCKIKNISKDPVFVQFPKMRLNEFSKFVDLEFVNENGYNKKIKTFLSKLDDFVVQTITNCSEDWFGKAIPKEFVSEMYLKKLRFVFDKGEIIDKHNEKLEISELVKGSILECISQLKYIVFTKDTCFLHWEICTAKLHKKTVRVPHFGFIEDPDDQSDDEIPETFTFF